MFGLVVFLAVLVSLDASIIKARMAIYKDLTTDEIDNHFDVNGLLKLDSSFLDKDFLKGKETLVQFSFAGCKPCVRDKKVFPILLSNTPDQFQIITISIDPFSFWKENNQDVDRWTKINIGKSDILEDLKVMVYPTYFFTNTLGQIESRPNLGINYVRARYDVTTHNLFELSREYIIDLNHSDRLVSYTLSYCLMYLVLFGLVVGVRLIVLKVVARNNIKKT